MLSLCGENSKKTVKAISKAHIGGKIYTEIVKNGRKYTALNCKAENNATYNLSVIYTALDKGPKTIVLGLREISRRYEFFDLSWLYDIDFELLNDGSIENVVCAGPYRYDFAVRMLIAGVPEEKLIILDTLDHAGEVFDKQTKGNVYGILNFDYIPPFINSVNEIKEEEK